MSQKKGVTEEIAGHIDVWKDILSEKRTYGDASLDVRQQARAYHTEHLLDWELDQARAAFDADHEESAEVDTLVSMVGFSPETTVVTAYTLQPKHLVLVYSKKSHEHIDHIYRELVLRRGVLNAGSITTRLCEAADPADIYQVIHKALAEARELMGDEGNKPNEYIDITGGKKVMSATSALVAWQLDLNICYIDSDIDKITRLPEPGSTRVIELGNPMTIFGAEELAVGERLFDEGNHSAARDHFERMRKRVADPGPAVARRHLAELYASWSGLDFDDLEAFIPRVREDIKWQRLVLPQDRLERLGEQLDYLQLLASDVASRPHTLLASYRMLGEHYDDLGRHDFAALLFYRTIESTLQSRLELAYGFDASNPDYDALPDGTLEEWAALNQGIYDKKGEGAKTFEPPYKLGLMACAVLLAALDDPLSASIRKVNVQGLKELRHLADTRNRSVLAHGHETIDRKLLKRLRELAAQFASGLGELHPGVFAGVEPGERLRFIRFGEKT